MRSAPLATRLAAATAELRDEAGIVVEGRVAGLSGLAVDIAGLTQLLAVADRVTLHGRDRRTTQAEIVGFAAGTARAMAFGATDGIGPGVRVTARPGHAGAVLHVDDGWVGRVIDPLGRPLDRKGALSRGPSGRATRCPPPEATGRARLGPRIDLGVRALNAFTTCRDGQRIGLFAGSGVGKSTLLSMLVRNTGCDVAVLALVGERGREVREFLEDDLGADGLARSVVVVATSDTPPLMRREAAYTAMTVAEHFRDAGKKVLLLMDSVTRYCLALREIGLAAGEPPATRGYPPSVFAELPRLLERAGPGPDRGEATGRITAFFTVLVEGDDHNEPVADAVRGILDGHVVLDRRIAEGGRYPAIDVLRSLSRAVPGCNGAEENALARRARRILALYADAADIVRLGAHRPGADLEMDEAIRLAPRIEAFLRQGREEASDIAASFRGLAEAMAG